MDEQQPIAPQPYAQSPIYQDNSGEGKNAKWLWILIALIIIGALAFAFFRGIGPFGMLKGDSQVSVTPTPTPNSFTTEPTPTPTPLSVDKESASIRVLNGSGQAGVAGSAKAFIESKGYKVTAVGNADNFDFTDTIVVLKKSFADFADALVADLSSKYSVKVSDEELEASDSADIEIIIGIK